MPNQVAFIVIDTGFSRESLAGANVLGFYDLLEGRTVLGAPWLDEETIQSFAGDPTGHGSVVLQNLRLKQPDAPLVLIRAFELDGWLIRTGFENHRQTAAGWTEAYIWAVEQCQKRGLLSVANCSFGGFPHAMDGSGWESVQTGRVTGPGRAGHILIAAAGPGDGRAAHASWTTRSGETTTVSLFQERTSTYNFWAGLPGSFGGAPDSLPPDWVLSVLSNGQVIAQYSAVDVPDNIWNHRRQLTFTIDGGGVFELSLTRKLPAGKSKRSNSVRFDCWALDDDVACFRTRVDAHLICEPAIFPQAIAVGLQDGQYSPKQTFPGEKPEVLLAGAGPISFRLPEVCAAVAELLSADPTLDVAGVRALLGKYPRL